MFTVQGVCWTRAGQERANRGTREGKERDKRGTREGQEKGQVRDK